jgi:hypothetical protein
MSEPRPLAAFDDATLDLALRELAPSIAWPAPVSGPSDVASRVRQRLVAVGATGPAARSGPLDWLRARPVRRGLLVAIALLLVLAAVAGAVGLGVPGIRIIFGGPTPSFASPTAPAASPKAGASNPLGIGLGLGTAVSLEDAERIGGFDLTLPTDPQIGPPDQAYVFVNRVALVWSERPGLPADADSGVALVLNEFLGSVDRGYYEKALESETKVTPVTVDGHPGYWISGQPHFFYYVDPSGRPVDDSHRMVGDTLIWSDGDVTFRIESQLGMDEAIRLAESLR